jgi:hypothetical protein
MVLIAFSLSEQPGVRVCGKSPRVFRVLPSSQLLSCHLVKPLLLLRGAIAFYAANVAAWAVFSDWGIDSDVSAGWEFRLYKVAPVRQTLDGEADAGPTTGDAAGIALHLVRPRVLGQVRRRVR